MIKIKFDKDKISIKGHSGYDVIGKDIVCASVSSIVITSINAIIRIDEKAISYTADKYGKQLVAIANRICDDLDIAEECENDTYLRAWNSIPPHEPRGYFFTFLAKITRNLALDRYKESNRLKRSATIVELTGELSEIIAGNDDTTANAESEELKNYINSFLRTLHKEKRNVFIRRYWYMDSVAEIADRYGISEGKVKTILFRVRNGLKQYLKKEGYYI